MIGPQILGPFKVVAVPSSVIICLKLPVNLRIRPTFHISKIKPVKSNSLCPQARPPPPTRLVDNHPANIVCQILDVCCQGRRLQYLVDISIERVVHCTLKMLQNVQR